MGNVRDDVDVVNVWPRNLSSVFVGIRHSRANYFAPGARPPSPNSARAELVPAHRSTSFFVLALRQPSLGRLLRHWKVRVNPRLPERRLACDGCGRLIAVQIKAE